MPTIHEATSRACGMSGRSTRAPIARPWSRGDGLLESRNGAADGNDGQAVRRSAPSWLGQSSHGTDDWEPETVSSGDPSSDLLRRKRPSLVHCPAVNDDG